MKHPLLLRLDDASFEFSRAQAAAQALDVTRRGLDDVQVAGELLVRRVEGEPLPVRRE